jgi:Ca2+-binding RTX toxin-like protein
MTVNCTDDYSNISSVYFQITSTSINENRSMTNSTGDLFVYSSTLGAGTYNISYVYCVDGNSNIKTNTTEITVVSSTRPSVVVGGGGGGSSTVYIYSGGNSSYFDIKTDTGSKKYDLLLGVDETRQKSVQVYNLDDDQITLVLSCMGDICDRVKLSETEFVLSGKQFKSVLFDISTKGLDKGETYYFAIKGNVKEINNTYVSDEILEQESRVDVFATITNLSYIRVWFNNFTESYLIFGIAISKLIVYLFIAFIATFITIALNKKRNEKVVYGTTVFFLTLLLVSVII